MRKLIRLKEWGELFIGKKREISELNARRIHALAERISQRLPGKPPVLTRTAKPTLRAGQVVGVLSTPSVNVEILPKVHTENDPNLRYSLVRMLAVARKLPIADHELAALSTQTENLLEILIRIFADRLSAAVRRGIPHRYISIEEELPRLKGKLDIKRQFSRNAVRPERFACKFDEFSADTPLNRLLKTAVARLLKISGSPANRRVLTELLARFDEVSDSLDPLREKVTLDRTNRMFHQLHAMAKLLLNGDWQSTSSGRVEGFSLLFPMNDLFEEYVGRSLKFALSTRNVELQNRQYHAIIDSPDNRFQLKPDIVVDGNIIVDTKWKELGQEQKNFGVKPSDIYQLLAYARAYSAKSVILLYPWHENLKQQHAGIYKQWQAAGDSAPIPFDIATVDVSKSNADVRKTLREILGCQDAEKAA
ncbi:MAG: McrC family protein [Gammaproteobacteria bacterium]|nr:McrC family protein [Gammaproteobacteria bacterium]